MSRSLCLRELRYKKRADDRMTRTSVVEVEPKPETEPARELAAEDDDEDDEMTSGIFA